MEKRVLQFSFLGLCAGFASAFLGIGGGVIMVPILLLMGFDIKKAIGTSLAAIILLSIVGTTTHFIVNPLNIQFFAVIILLMGAVFGSKIGVELVKRLHSRILAILFGLFLVVVALKMVGVISLGAAEATGAASSNPWLLLVG